MRRYLLFAWSDYEGMGGWHDFVDSYASIDEARRSDAYKRTEQWIDTLRCHIVDSQTGMIIEQIGESLDI